MHVLYVIHYPVFGGPQNYAVQLRPHLEKAGHRLTVILPAEPGNAVARMTSGGVDAVQMPLGRARAVKTPSIHASHLAGFLPDVARLRRFIRDEAVDVVVVTTLIDTQAAIAARAEGVAVVWQVVGTRTPPPARIAMMPIVDRMADAVMFNGQALFDLHGGGKLSTPTYLFASPVDCERFTVSPNRRRRTRLELGIPADAPVVGTVANINPQKGIEHFARAAPLIHAMRSDAWFLIVGSEYDNHQDYAREIKESLAASLIPSDRVLFLGDRTDCEAIYPALDVKVISSVPRSEGTTTTAMESMACGVPVVTTDVGAVKEVVDDEHTGFVVPPENPPAIARAVIRLLDDPELCRAYGTAGREAAVARFDASHFAATHLEAFETARERASLRGASRLLRSGTWRGRRR